MNDFRKYATKHLGINGLVFDEVVSSQAQYLNPYILEERQLNVTQMDVFSRLMMDRIIFLGTQIDDYTANTLQAQLLYLTPRIRARTYPYISTPPEEVLPRVSASMTRCNLSPATWPPSVPAWPHQWLQCCSWPEPKANARR